LSSIRIQSVTKQLGDRVVLSNVTIDLHAGEIVGVVGPNGAGKTTLFRLIEGALKPDWGTVTRSRETEVGYLAQEPDVRLDRTLHDEVLSAFAPVLELERRLHDVAEQMSHAADAAVTERLMEDYDRLNAHFVAAGGYGFERRVREILGGLGFSAADHALPMTALSGGQKCRAALAKLLMCDATYLLLDEPTNHLDIDAVRWLEKFLAGHHGGAAIISHDRYLLDRVADRIVEVERGGVASYPGAYTEYARTRELRRLTQDRQFEKDKAFIEKEKAFIAKHLAGQRTREAQGRRTRLQRRLADGEFTTDRAADRRTLAFEFEAEVQSGRVVIEASGLSKAYGEKRLFSEFSTQALAGQRIGITGPNGAGKSTLLKILLGRLEPDEGGARIDAKATVGYYAQEAPPIEPERTVVGDLLRARPELTEARARSILGGFLFSGEDVFKRLAALSGGEHSRLRLLKLLLSQPNLLVLDEPTNHLDIDSREALEAALEAYPGTILAVSHDRYFLDRVVHELILMRDGRHERRLGGYTEYIEAAEREAQRAARAAPRADRTSANSAGEPGGERRGKRAASSARGGRPSGSRARSRNASQPASRFDKMALEELEAFITQAEERLPTFDGRFADPKIFKQPAELARLRAEYDALRTDLADAEASWFRRAEA
jgi:ATP-binding cassette subfamily F protein 3